MKRLTAKEFMTLSPQRQRWVLLEAIRFAAACLSGLARPSKRPEVMMELFDRGVYAAAMDDLPGATRADGERAGE